MHTGFCGPGGCGKPSEENPLVRARSYDVNVQYNVPSILVSPVIVNVDVLAFSYPCPLNDLTARGAFVTSKMHAKESLVVIILKRTSLGMLIRVTFRSCLSISWKDLAIPVTKSVGDGSVFSIKNFFKRLRPGSPE